jgi:hypothetical protein
MNALDSCKEYFLMARAQTNAYRDSLAVYKEANKKLMQADSSSRKEITTLRLTLEKAEQQIELFKKREAEVELPPVFEWMGFYVNVSTYFRFDSTVIAASYFSQLKYALILDWQVQILSKIKLHGELQIPFKEKPVLLLRAGYRLF